MSNELILSLQGFSDHYHTKYIYKHTLVALLTLWFVGKRLEAVQQYCQYATFLWSWRATAAFNIVQKAPVLPHILAVDLFLQFLPKDDQEILPFTSVFQGKWETFWGMTWNERLADTPYRFSCCLLCSSPWSIPHLREVYTWLYLLCCFL